MRIYLRFSGALFLDPLGFVEVDLLPLHTIELHHPQIRGYPQPMSPLYIEMVAEITMLMLKYSRMTCGCKKSDDGGGGGKFAFARKILGNRRGKKDLRMVELDGVMGSLCR